ncbi:hypothetical protein BC941DRAFT_410392 [Chlamydoabsidia padenii]|nr:hypothetical protein BC941DRAFT_410392 [Chlamydoabsidia padenii]
MSSTSNRTASPPLHRPIDGTSFCLGAKPFLLSKSAQSKPITFKKKRRRFKQSIPMPSLTSTRNQRQEQNDDTMENLPITNVLEGVVIFIDKNSVANKDRLTRVAYALSATVIDKWAPSATHLIHGSITQPLHSSFQQTTRTPVLITKSLNRKMRVVAPTWLLACYDQKKRMPETLYPYEMDSKSRLTSLTAHSTTLQQSSNNQAKEDDNPFGLEPEEFAQIEDYSEDDDNSRHDPLANNRRMTDYFQRTTNNNNNNDHDDDDDQNDIDNDFGGFDDDPIQQQPNESITGGGGEIDDDASSMSYSLLEMSQAVPMRPQGVNESVCAYTNNRTTPSNTSSKPQGNDTPSDNIPTLAGLAMQQMANVYEGLEPPKIKHEEWTVADDGIRTTKHGDDDAYHNDDDDVEIMSVLPDIDPSRLSKKTLGREDRLQIWYGEQSFCLDADLTRSPSDQQQVVDLTSSLPSIVKSNPRPPSTSKRTTNASTSRLTTIKSTSAKKLKKTH